VLAAAAIGLGLWSTDADVRSGRRAIVLAVSQNQAKEKVVSVQDSSSTAAEIRLLPQPKSIKLASGRLELGSVICVVAEDPALATDAEILVEDLAARISGDVRACRAGRAPAGSTVITLAMAKSLDGLPDEAFQGYALDIDGDGVRITGIDSDGVFYGAQTLLQILDNFESPQVLPAVSIRDWPDLRYRGTQHDTRGQIARMDTLEKHIRTLAYFKYNQFYIYIENMFCYTKHPDIPPECALQPAQARKLAEFARGFHVDLVPMQQSLGHQSQLLRVPAYTHLAESQEHIPGTNHLWVLSPAFEGTYELLGDMYDDIVSAFPSKFLHAACDEAGSLGKGASKELADKIGVGGVFVEHIKRLRKLLPADRRLGVWGDMPLNHKDEIEGKIPKDTIIYDWHYIPQDDGYPSVKWFRDQGLDVVVCPANLGYGKVFPDVYQATLNMERFIAVGKREGALGMLNCVWELWYQNFFDFVWYGLAYGADVAWSSDESMRAPDIFNARFARVFFRSDEAELANLFRLLAEPNHILRQEWPDASWFQVMKMYWENPRRQEYTNTMNKLSVPNRGYHMFTRGRLNAIAGRILARADFVLTELDRLSGTVEANAEVLDTLRYAAARYRFFAHRLLYVQSARDAYEYALKMLPHKDAVKAALADARELANALAEELAHVDGIMTGLWHERRQVLGLDRARSLYTRNITIYSKMAESLEAARAQYDTDGTLPAAADVGLEQVIPIAAVPAKAD